MEDQRRVFLAIALTVGIFLGWQWLVKTMRPAPSAPPAPVAATPTPVASPDSAPSTVAAKAAAIAGAPAATPVVVDSSEAFETPLFSGSITSSGALSGLHLKRYQEQQEDSGRREPVSLVTATIENARRQAVITVSVAGIAVPLSFAERGPSRFVMSGEREGAAVTLTANLVKDRYAVAYDLKVENKGSASVKAAAKTVLALAENASAAKPGFLAPASDMVSGLCEQSGSVKRATAADVAEAAQAFAGAAWAGLDRQYFVVGLVPEGGGGECKVSARETTVLVDYALGEAEVAAGASWSKRFSVYLGPKRDTDLAAVSEALRSVIDYNIWKIPLGFLARPMVVVLNVFYGWTQSWGVAIILLTFLVKLLLFPVTYKSVVSMRRMSLLKPEIEKLKAKHGTDRERMQLEQMKLFREKGVNPLGGCLPMLLQMPVWFALYRTLWTAVDLYQQKFLWLDNLTAKEPFPFLAIAFGLLTVAQQKLTPTTMDSQQAKMMTYVMPVVFAFFMISLPSGLVLYIVVNSILTIVQQAVINSRQAKA